MKALNRFYVFPACLVIAYFLSGCNRERIFSVQTKLIELDSLDQVKELTDSLVQPLLYTNVKSFDQYSPEEIKSKFIALLLPAILVAKHEREMDQIRYKKLMGKKVWYAIDTIRYRHLLSRYRARDKDDLALKMQTLPNSIVLAQAAVESGWGKSRFFVEAKNVFGIWSFNETDNRIEAREVRGDRKVYVRAYSDLSGSVRDYFNVLSQSNAFRGLRIIRQSTDDPMKLIPYLRNYSERKGKYTRLLESMIRQNDLRKYDHYRIDPDYLVEEE